MDSGGALSIEVAADTSVVVVALRGELDLAGCDDVEPVLLATLETADEVVVDLGNVTFCDSSGLAMFLNTHAAAERAGKRLLLRNLLPNVWRIVEVCGLDQHLDIAR